MLSSLTVIIVEADIVYVVILVHVAVLIDVVNVVEVAIIANIVVIFDAATTVDKVTTVDVIIIAHSCDNVSVPERLPRSAHDLVQRADPPPPLTSYSLAPLSPSLT